MLRILIGTLLDFIEKLLRNEVTLATLTCNIGISPFPSSIKSCNDTSVPMAYFLGITNYADPIEHVRAGHVDIGNHDPLGDPFIVQDSEYSNLIMFHIIINRGIINVTMRFTHIMLDSLPHIEIIKIDYYDYGLNAPAHTLADKLIQEINSYADLLSKGLYDLTIDKRKEVLDLF